MTETFSVECPGCNDPKTPLSTNAQTIGIHCSCGVTATVDVEAQSVSDWWER